MSEAFGSFSFSKSVDFEADVVGLLNAMNEMFWCDGSAEWGAYDTPWGLHIQTKIGYHNGDFLFPTVFPEVIKGAYLEDAEGKDVFVENPSKSELDAAYDFTTEEATLREISKILSPFIKKGSFEISCVSSAKYTYTLCERLSISANGGAERNRYVNGSDHSYQNLAETV